MLYLRATFLFLMLRHALKLRERQTILKLTAILQYSANVLRQRVNPVRFGDLAASDYLMSL